MTLAAAKRFLLSNNGEVFDTVQTKANGSVWSPGPRTLTAKGNSNIFRFNESRFEIQKGMTVTHLSDTSVTFDYGTDWGMAVTYSKVTA